MMIRRAVAVAGALLAATMIVLLLTGSAIDLSRADQAASVTAAVIGLATVIVALMRRPGKPAPSTVDQLAAAEVALAGAVRKQWREEADRRGIRNAPLASIRWTVSGDVVPATAAQRPQRPVTEEVVTAWRATAGCWLFVVGDAGAGKTTFAILLTLEVADPSSAGPVPVLLSAASWNPRVPFTEWVARRLRDTYRFLDQREEYGGTAAEDLVNSTRLMIILDGLDELQEPRRQRALEALGRTVPRDRPLVVTTRDMPSLPAADQGEMAAPPPVAVLHLQRMEPQAALDYLAAAGPREDQPVPVRRWWWPARRTVPSPPGGRADPRRADPRSADPRWAYLAAALTDPDAPVRNVLTVPLFASLARRMYADSSVPPAELADRRRFPTEATLRAHLVAGFLRVALRMPLPRRSGSDRRAWGTVRAQQGLRLLARHLHQENLQNIEWWRLEAMVGTRILTGAGALSAAILYGLTVDLPTGMRRGAALGFAVAVIISLSRGRLHGRTRGVRVGLTSGLAIALVGWWQTGLGAGLQDGAELGLGIGICVAHSALLRRGPAAAAGVAARTGVMLGLLMGVIDTVRVGPADGVVRLLTTGPGVMVSVGMPLLLSVALRATEPPGQPGRLNLDLARTRPLLVPLGVGTLCGFAVGLGGALIGGLRYAVVHGTDAGLDFAVRVGLTYSVSVGLGIGLVGGLVHWLTQPSERRTAADPLTTLRAARTVALCYLLVPAFTCAATLMVLDAAGVTPPSATAAPATALTGAGLGLCLGTVFATGFTAWPDYLLVRLAVLLAGGPPDLLRLCAAAHEAEILRLEGAAYQFRHAELRERLSTWQPRQVWWSPPQGRGTEPRTR